MTTPSRKSSGNKTTSVVASFLDTSRPNTARIFNYFLGGTANFEVDRKAAQEIEKIIPAISKWVRLRHAFVQDAAQLLYADGFRQFLDLGSGMPTEDHIHAFLADARIVYSDINPVAVSYGNSLFADLENVIFIDGNAASVETILEKTAVQSRIHTNEKTAIGLNSVSLFISAQDHRQLSQTLYDWAHPDSKIFLILQTIEKESEQYQEFLKINAKAGLPLQLRSFDQMVEILKPWRIIHKEPAISFLGLPNDFFDQTDPSRFEFSFHAVILDKS